MTTYRLPDWLGGHEVDVRGTRGDGQLIVIPRGIVPAGLNPTEIHIDRDELTEVKPPLPPEPPNDGAFWFDPKEDLGEVWYRAGDGWLRIGGKYRFEWTAVCEQTDPSKWMRLVKDPADDAPELPLRIKDEEGSLIARIEPSDAYKDRLFVDIQYTHLVRKDVRQLAAALWAWAAREVEKP